MTVAKTCWINCAIVRWYIANSHVSLNIVFQPSRYVQYSWCDTVGNQTTNESASMFIAGPQVSLT
jgi:hypothetical protein